MHRTHLQRSHVIHGLRESAPCERARVKYMLSLSMASSAGKSEGETRVRLYEAALSIHADLTGSEMSTQICEDMLDKVVEGQLR